MRRFACSDGQTEQGFEAVDMLAACDEAENLYPAGGKCGPVEVWEIKAKTADDPHGVCVSELPRYDIDVEV